MHTRRFGLVLVLIATNLAAANTDDVPRTPEAIRAWLESPTPPRPELPADVAERVAELDAKIDTLREAEAFDEAIALAEEVLAIRSERQTGWTDQDGAPADWWEVIDARRRVENLRRFSALAPAERAALPEAEQHEARMMEAYGRGAYAEAARFCEARLAVNRRELGDDHPDTLNSIHDMGFLLRALGKLAEAESYYREALDGKRRVLGDDDPSTLNSINNMGTLLEAQGKLAEAEPYYREALDGRRRVLGDDHPDTLNSIHDMGFLLQTQGKLAEAEPYYREALDGYRRVLGDDHPETLNSINNMGTLLQAQGKLAEAEPYYREALDGYRRVLGDDHPSTLDSINNMGVLLQAQGKPAEAEPYYREALDGKRRVLGDDHPETLTSINNMGTLLEAQWKLAEAEPYYREALDGYRRVLGDDHPDTLNSINNMGFLLEALGKLAEAEPYYREALDGRRRVLGDDHPDTLISINNMGFLLEAQGKLAEAEPYYREALDGKRRVLGDDHPSTLQSINNMGFLLQAQGKLAEAEPYYREALDGYRRVLGDDHPDTLKSINNMGILLEAQGKPAEAEPYWREALDGRRRVLGDDHPHTLQSINNMGFLLQAQGKLAKAEPYYREALDGYRRVLGDDHPDTLISINNMGFLLEAQGKLAEAEPYWREALDGRRRVLGDDHPDTLQSINNMGFLLEAQGKPAEAEPYYREALDGRRRVLGDDHPDTLGSINARGVLLDEQGKPAEAERYYREALGIAERLRGQATGGESGRAAMAGKTGLRTIAGNLVTLLAQAERPTEAWTMAERGRSRSLLDLLARSEQDIVALASDPARLEAAQVQGSDARVTLTIAETRLAALRTERATIATIDGLDENDRAARLATFDGQLDAQHDLILNARRNLAEATAGVFLELRSIMPDAQPMTAETIRAALAPDEVMLGYVWTDDAVVLLAAGGAGGMTGTLVADGEDAVAALAETVAAVRAALTNRGRSNWMGVAPETAALAATLLPETARAIITGASRVVILPDGPLAGLPFDVLAFDVDDSVLDDARVQIVYASSATVYLNRRDAGGTSAPAGTAALVALGDPMFVRDAAPEPDYPMTGVLVSNTVEGGNAAAAGLARGDVFLTYAGTDVRDYDHLLELKTATSAEVETGVRAADDALPVRYWRDGTVHETTMTPGAFGVYLDQSTPERGLRLMAEASRGMDERLATASMLDLVRLHGGELPRLPGTRVEVERIGTVAAAAGLETSTLTETTATLTDLETALSGAAGDVRYLHLATHGLTGSADRPYDASLALTVPGTPTTDDIGFLTLDHLIRTWRGKLDGCDLVVLSACDTQRGVRKGDSLMALPWGFFFAGAPTVVASLWQIDDEATALLMGRFYENLLGAHADERTMRGTSYPNGAPMPKADALQEAKRWLRTYEVEDRGVIRLPGRTVEKRRPYAHPYYWAAFVLIGDPD